jgi:hypothetical protein
MTGTFKHCKAPLAGQGFDPEAVHKESPGDRLFLYRSVASAPGGWEVVEIDGGLYEDIQSGGVRL